MAHENKDGGPAFPYAFQHEDDQRFIKEGFASGMTLRDYFAGQAPEVPEWFPPNEWTTEEAVNRPTRESPGWMTMEIVEHVEPHIEHLVRWKFAYADAMLAARSGERK